MFDERRALQVCWLKPLFVYAKIKGKSQIFPFCKGRGQ